MAERVPPRRARTMPRFAQSKKGNSSYTILSTLYLRIRSLIARDPWRLPLRDGTQDLLSRVWSRSCRGFQGNDRLTLPNSRNQPWRDVDGSVKVSKRFSFVDFPAISLILRFIYNAILSKRYDRLTLLNPEDRQRHDVNVRVDVLSWLSFANFALTWHKLHYVYCVLLWLSEYGRLT